MNYIALILIGVSWSRVTASFIDSPPNKYLDQAKRFLPELCPGADVCLDNNITMTTDTSRTGLNGCCTKCSCQADCIKANNCCFPDQTPSPPNFQQPKSDCLYPMIPQPLDISVRLRLTSYIMVSSVSKQGDTLNQTNCGEEKVAPWGSFLPVYSKETQTIYKNNICAKAAGVLDGIVWNVYISCMMKMPTSGFDDVSVFTSAFLRENLPDDCEIHFLYPGKYSDIDRQVCFKDLITTCPLIKFEMPKELQTLSRKEIRDLCRSGLSSPYRNVNFYGNVFCHICNGESFSPNFLCSVSTNTLQRQMSGNFVGLIDSGSFFAARKEKVIKERQLKQAYYINKENDQTTRRRIHCPSGRIFDENGACIFPVKTWLVGSIAVCIKLTSDMTFNIYEAFQLSIYDTSVMPALSHQWSDYWFIYTVSYELLNTSNHNSIFVQMVNKQPLANPYKILKNIRNCLTLPWTLKINDTFLPMTAELVHMLTPYHVTLADQSSGGAEDDKVMTPKYIYIYEFLTRYKPMYISQLYYNELIELNHSEFILFGENKFLLDKITNRTFLVGEFTTEQDSKGQYKARISLRSSGFFKDEQNGGIASKHDIRPIAFVWICRTLLRLV